MFDMQSKPPQAFTTFRPMRLTMPAEARVYLRAWVVKFVRENGELMDETTRPTSRPVSYE